MTRCDYCTYRNGWDCGDGWGRVSESCLCDSFSLDFSAMSEELQKRIQTYLMMESIVKDDSVDTYWGDW